MSQSRPNEEQIKSRAYEIYLSRGRLPGHEIDDWLQAEYELMQLPIHRIAELAPAKLKRSQRHRQTLVRLVHTALLLGAAFTPQARHLGSR